MSDIEPVQCTRPNSRRVNKHLMSRLVVKQIFVVTGTISEKHWATALKHSEVIVAMLYSLHSEISQYATSWRMSWMFWNGLQSHFSKVKSVFYFHPITDKDISLYRQMHDAHAQADINFRLQLRDCSNSEYIILNEQIRCLKQETCCSFFVVFFVFVHWRKLARNVQRAFTHCKLSEAVAKPWLNISIFRVALLSTHLWPHPFTLIQHKNRAFSL